MGGKSAPSKVINKVGKAATNVVGKGAGRVVGDIAKTSTKAYGDVWKFGNEVLAKPATQLFSEGVRGVTHATGEAIGEITGANAMRKQAMDAQQAAEEEARRQSDVSDAMARNAGGDPTAIFLSSGKRRRAGGGGTGSSGTGNSRDTGVQY